MNMLLAVALHYAHHFHSLPTVRRFWFATAGIFSFESDATFSLKPAWFEVLLSGPHCAEGRPTSRKVAVTCLMRLRPRCHPSMSLLVRMAFMYKLQVDGGHVVLLIQMVSMYSINCCSLGVDAFACSCAYIAGISVARRNGRAMTFPMNK